MRGRGGLDLDLTLSPQVRLRAPEPRDASALAELLALLGHPAEPADVTRRLTELERLDPEGLRLVADLDGVAIGFVSAHLTPMIHRDRPVGRVTTLVVDERRQRGGVGTLLLSAAEEWLAARAAVRLELTSGDGRVEAHAFYERRGWHKEGVRFVRYLDSAR